MKWIIVALFSLPFFALAKGHGQGGKGPCAQYKCFHKKDAAAKKACREKKRQCKQEHFTKRLDKFKSDGIPEKKRTKIVERLTKKIEMKKAHKENLSEDIKFFEEHLNAVKALPAKK